MSEIQKGQNRGKLGHPTCIFQSWVDCSMDWNRVGKTSVEGLVKKGHLGAVIHNFYRLGKSALECLWCLLLLASLPGRNCLIFLQKVQLTVLVSSGAGVEFRSSKEPSAGKKEQPGIWFRQ